MWQRLMMISKYGDLKGVVVEECFGGRPELRFVQPEEAGELEALWHAALKHYPPSPHE